MMLSTDALQLQILFICREPRPAFRSSAYLLSLSFWCQRLTTRDARYEANAELERQTGRC